MPSIVSRLNSTLKPLQGGCLIFKSFWLIIDNCGPGFYSSTGVAKCFRCPFGTYSSDERNKACISCPNGTSTVIDASKGIEDCGSKCF